LAGSKFLIVRTFIIALSIELNVFRTKSPLTIIKLSSGKVTNFEYGNFDIEKFNFENGNFEFNFELDLGGWGVTADDDRGCYDPV